LKINTELDSRSLAFGMIAATERNFERMIDNLISAKTLLEEVKGRKQFCDKLQKMIERFEIEYKRIEEMLSEL